MTALIVFSPVASAQDLEPRSYSNSPVGLNFLIAGYGNTDGAVAFDPAVPLTDAQIRTDSGVLAYVRTLDSWGHSAKFDVMTTVTSLSGSALYQGESRERDITGMSDARFRYTIMLHGAPAMTLKEFARYQQDLNIGVNLAVSTPTGQYDSSKLVNIGTNRWSMKAELGISKALGDWTLELMPAVTFYTDNHDFMGGKTLSQDPIYSVQGHVVHTFRRGMWLSLDATYFTGGRTSTDGVDSSTKLKNSRAGLTFSMPVNRRNSLKLYASQGTATRTGSDYTALRVAWQYPGGAGI
jgi:hypothetical protein